MPVPKIDWKQWEPTERATLCFICKGDQILLIQKKRGLGAGKVNGPGGHIESGETPLQCAIRETQEEVLVTPLHLQQYGELYFDFVDGCRLHCVVFRADDLLGEPGETAEAVPFWAPVHTVPYEKMWTDDRYWLPLLLTRKNFCGYFQFDNETMLAHEVITP